MKYHISLRLMHWLMALIIVGIITIGWYMTGLTTEDESRSDYYFYHKSFGVLILILLVARIFIRKFTRRPSLPENIKPIEKKLSHYSHNSLYVLMFFVPVIGYVFSNSAGYSVSFFGFMTPDIVDKNKMLSDIARQAHWYAAYILFCIILIHMVAALKHRLFEVNENDVLNRML